jgi:CRP-like cAMP-binding protein
MTDDAWKVSALRGVEILRGIPAADLATLAQNGQRRTFRAGGEVFRKGDLAEDLYVIAKGRVRVELAHAELTAPVIAYFGAGDLLGQEGLLDGDPRLSTVIALERTEVLALSADSLVEFVLAGGERCGPLLKRLSRRLQTVDDLARKYGRRDGDTAAP